MNRSKQACFDKGATMKLIPGGLRPGEKPKYRPKTGTIVVPSLNLALSADGRIVLTSPSAQLLATNPPPHARSIS